MKKNTPQRRFAAPAALVFALLLFPVLAGSAGAQNMAPAGEVVEHQVVEGDNLSLMAGYYYKNPRLWKRIYSLNSDMLDDPNIVLPGTTVKVPADPGRQWDIPYGEYLSRIFD